MKTKAVLVLMILAFVMSAVAADKPTDKATTAAIKGSAEVNVSRDVQLAGKSLKAGDYKLIWSGTANDVKVTFKTKGKEVATVPAKVVERNTRAEANSIVTNGDKLVEFWQGGKKSALVFE